MVVLFGLIIRLLKPCVLSKEPGTILFMLLFFIGKRMGTVFGLGHCLFYAVYFKPLNVK